MPGEEYGYIMDIDPKQVHVVSGLLRQLGQEGELVRLKPAGIGEHVRYQANDPLSEAAKVALRRSPLVKGWTQVSPIGAGSDVRSRVVEYCREESTECDTSGCRIYDLCSNHSFRNPDISDWDEAHRRVTGQA